VTYEFYQRVAKDERLAPFFDGMDMARQSRMLAAFLAMATGGPATYRGRSLRNAHADLEITDEDFDLVVGHLAETLSAFSVDDEVISQMAALAGSVRHEVTGHVAPALPAG
jgi:hemoglobin